MSTASANAGGRAGGDVPMIAFSGDGTGIPVGAAQYARRFGDALYNSALSRFKPLGIPPNAAGHKFLGLRGIHIYGFPRDLSYQELAEIKHFFSRFGGHLVSNYFTPGQRWGNIQFHTMDAAISAYLEEDRYAEWYAVPDTTARKYVSERCIPGYHPTVNAYTSAFALFKPRGIGPDKNGCEFLGCRSIYISNIPRGTKSRDRIISLFSRFGKVKMYSEPASTWGTVELESVDQAVAAFLELTGNKFYFDGVAMELAPARQYDVWTTPKSIVQARHSRATSGPVIVRSLHCIKITGISKDQKGVEAFFNHFDGRKGGVRCELVYDADNVAQSQSALVPFSNQYCAETAMLYVRRYGFKGHEVQVSEIF